MNNRIYLINDLIDKLDRGLITDDRFIRNLHDAGLNLQHAEWIDDCCGGGYAYSRYSDGSVYAETTPYGWVCGMVANGR